MLNEQITIGNDDKADAYPQSRVTQAADVFNKHETVILATIRSNINDKSQANDILHDFFLSLIHKPIPSHIQNVKGYLQRAVKNDVLDAANRKKSYRARIHRYAEYHKDTIIHQDPQNIAIQTEQAQKMVELIKERLPHHEAQTVIERCYHDRTTEQTAEKMCVNRRSVSRYLCMGLKRIRRLINENSVDVNVHT